MQVIFVVVGDPTRPAGAAASEVHLTVDNVAGLKALLRCLQLSNKHLEEAPGMRGYMIPVAHWQAPAFLYRMLLAQHHQRPEPHHDDAGVCVLCAAMQLLMCETIRCAGGRR